MIETNKPIIISVCMGSSCFVRGNKQYVKIVQDYIENKGIKG